MLLGMRAPRVLWGYSGVGRCRGYPGVGHSKDSLERRWGFSASRDFSGVGHFKDFWGLSGGGHSRDALGILGYSEVAL